MGGDGGVAPNVSAALEALKAWDFDLTLAGDEKLIRAELLRQNGGIPSHLEILHAPETVTMEDSAVAPLRSKKNSSIRRGIDQIKDGRAQAFVSAGHTGACMAAAKVVLGEKENDVVATSQGSFGRHEHRVRVVWDRHSFPRYRFSVDDNSFFLRDVAQKDYNSLFDCFYLDVFRTLHKKYGTKFVLNIYYTTGDDFNLTQFPDRYRGQWQDNADWLKLAFHAYANEPARPYQYAAPQKLIAELDLVAEQIVRFAGEATYTPPTVIHWGMVQPAALKPLAGRGVRALSGYFRMMRGNWDVNYLMDDDRSEYLSRHDAMKDFDSGIVFSRVDLVCNSTPIAEIVAKIGRAHV